MKRTFKTFLLTLCFGIAGISTFGVNLPIYDLEVAVRYATDGIDQRQEDSLIPATCQAFRGNGHMEILFNKFIGEEIIQAGKVISTALAETEIENTVYVQLPVSDRTCYFPKIGSDGYKVEKTFTI